MFSRDVARLTSQAGRCSWGLPFRYLDFDFPGLDATPQQASWVDLKISNIHFWRFERYWKKIIPTYKTWRERERERSWEVLFFLSFCFFFTGIFYFSTLQVAQARNIGPWGVWYASGWGGCISGTKQSRLLGGGRWDFMITMALWLWMISI